MQQKRQKPKDARPRYTLSQKALDLVDHALRLHNDNLLPGQKRKTSSDLIEQLILDNIKDPVTMKMQRLAELASIQDQAAEEIKEIKLFLKQQTAKQSYGSERELFEEELNKQKKK